MKNSVKMKKEIDKYKDSVKKIQEAYRKIWLGEVDIDVDLSEENLDKIAISRSRIYNKWAKRMLRVSRLYNRLDHMKEQITSDLYNYYLLDCDINYKQSEIKEQIKGHERYQDICELIDDVKEIVKFLELTIKNIDNIQWDIRNYIEWKKLLMV